MPKISEQLKGFFVRHKGVTAYTAFGTVGSTVIFAYFLYSIKSSLRIPTKVIETEKFKNYIYLEKERFKKSFHQNPNKGLLSPEARQYIKEILPAPIAKFVLLFDRKGVNLAEDYVSPWSVLHEAYSRNKRIRLRAVEAIAAYKDWNDEKRPRVKAAKKRKLEDCLSSEEIDAFDWDAEFCTLAQSLDAVTSIGLARTHNVDRRLFRPPPALPPLNNIEEIEDLLRDLLMELPQRDVEKCIQYFTSGALTLSDDQQRNRGGLWCFGGNGINYTRDIRPQAEVELLCLQALSKHSLFEEHCKVMVELGALQLMQRIKDLRPDDLKIQNTIVRTVSNICLYPQFHRQIFQSGWVSILAEMSNSDKVSLRLQASRGLANLDREVLKEQFRDGVCTLHPRHRTKVKPEADIVFVHGLLGGAFYSWRRPENTSSTASYDLRKIHCWPEEWLPTDLPGCRVLCVDYDTTLSEWLSLCPHESERRTISYRSREILNNTIEAGIGDRPIVWVTHSMGGLIVKHMLLDAMDNPEKYGKVLKQTKGIVFFGTPHGGSQLATYSQGARKILFPSMEVMELSQDSPKLKQLNEILHKLVTENSLKVLSFGETQSTNIGFGKLIKLHIVSPESANPGVGEFILADTNHLNLCKPASRQSTIYQQTLKFIRSSLTKEFSLKSDDENEESDIHPVLL